MALVSYKELGVWQKSFDAALKIYTATNSFPIQRAAISIPSNIAEGYARNHTKEYLQYIGIAYGSLCEL